MYKNEEKLIQALLPKIAEYFTEHEYLKKEDLSDFLDFIDLNIWDSESEKEIYASYYKRLDYQSSCLLYEVVNKSKIKELVSMKSFIIKGNVCHTTSASRLDLHDNSYVVCVDGVSKGVFKQIPSQYEYLPVVDCGDKLIFPGLVDLHAHAPQYVFRGLCMDLELMDWLQAYTFPEESKYQDLQYAPSCQYSPARSRCWWSLYFR